MYGGGKPHPSGVSRSSQVFGEDLFFSTPLPTHSFPLLVRSPTCQIFLTDNVSPISFSDETGHHVWEPAHNTPLLNIFCALTPSIGLIWVLEAWRHYMGGFLIEQWCVEEIPTFLTATPPPPQLKCHHAVGGFFQLSILTPTAALNYPAKFLIQIPSPKWGGERNPSHSSPSSPPWVHSYFAPVPLALSFLFIATLKLYPN